MKYYAAQMCDNGNIAVDDTILVKGVESTAGSHILEGFKPLFSAEAVTRLEDKGYTVAGKANVGEFGLDLVGEFSYYAPQDEKLSGAAATLVAQGDVKAALGVDMNGATRRSAALANIDFLKPTYGTVSRYGVISCAASGEQIGVYAQNADGIKEIMSVIAGHDDKDGTSLPAESYDYATDKEVSGKKVCIIKELFEKADEATKAKVNAFADSLRANGVTVEEISCDLFEIANTAWQILMSAETCNNVSRYDGVKYGHRTEKYRNIDELYVNTRTEGFNFLTKAVILYGSDVLSKNRYKDCYDKSLRVRRVVAESIAKLMESYDAVLTPVCSKTEYEKYDIHEAFTKVFEESVFTAVPNLIGTPALVSNGVQLMGKHFDESVLLSLAHSVERKGE
ncbi:MAG: amidase family protein [Acutalibacteraceae bacterium]|nr:amidase family protein [Acutalibacteraceae bacterium]